MLKFFNTIKYRMSIIVILALLLQIFMPVIENYAYAQEELGIAEEELEVDEPIEEVQAPEEAEEPENPGEEDNGAAGSDIQPTEDKQPETMDQKPENVETMEVETAGEDEEPISNANESKLIEEDIIDNLRLFRKDVQSIKMVI